VLVCSKCVTRFETQPETHPKPWTLGLLGVGRSRNSAWLTVRSIFDVEPEVNTLAYVFFILKVKIKSPQLIKRIQIELKMLRFYTLWRLNNTLLFIYFWSILIYTFHITLTFIFKHTYLTLHMILK
jgi:hypothetical protein